MADVGVKELAAKSKGLMLVLKSWLQTPKKAH